MSKIDFSLVENNIECITNIIGNFIKNHTNEEKEAIQFLNFINVDSIDMEMQEFISIFKLFSFSSLCSKLVQIYSNQQKELECDFEYEISCLQNQITELNEKLYKHYDEEKVFKPIITLPYFHTPNIFQSIWECNLNDVQYFIEICKDDPNKFHNGRTPLMYAACNGNIPIIRYLVEKAGADVNLVVEGDPFYREAIHLAAQNGQIPALQYFIHEVGIDVNCRNTILGTPLMFSCASGSLKTVKYLIEEENADIEAVDLNGSKCLHYACSTQNNMEIIQYLIDELNFDVNLKDLRGWLPLTHSVCHGDLDAVKYFIEIKGVNAFFSDTLYGDTHLHLAASFGRLEVVKYLLSKGLDKSILNNHLEIPYSIVCAHQNADLSHLEEIKRLLKID